MPFPFPGDLPEPGIELGSPALEADALTSEPPGEPYSAIKKNQIMMFSTTGSKAEVIILSEVGETEQDKNHIVSLLGGI